MRQCGRCGSDDRLVRRFNGSFPKICYFSCSKLSKDRFCFPKDFWTQIFDSKNQGRCLTKEFGPPLALCPDCVARTWCFNPLLIKEPRLGLPESCTSSGCPGVGCEGPCWQPGVTANLCGHRGTRTGARSAPSCSPREPCRLPSFSLGGRGPSCISGDQGSPRKGCDQAESVGPPEPPGHGLLCWPPFPASVAVCRLQESGVHPG